MIFGDNKWHEKLLMPRSNAVWERPLHVASKKGRVAVEKKHLPIVLILHSTPLPRR